MRRIIYDVKKGETKVVEENIELPKVEIKEPVTINLEELKQLLDYAKKQGWIKA